MNYINIGRLPLDFRCTDAHAGHGWTLPHYHGLGAPWPFCGLMLTSPRQQASRKLLTWFECCLAVLRIDAQGDTQGAHAAHLAGSLGWD